MSDKYESMDGIMKLYDLRREAVMREARDWFAGFYAESFEDVINVFQSEDDRFFRMTLTYWDMAASFVNHGAIDEAMFNDSNTEHIAVFAKIAPFVGEFREFTKIPDLLVNLEKLVLRILHAEEKMEQFRERTKERQAAKQKAATA